MRHIMMLTDSPRTNSGYATVVKNLAPELVKLGYNVAITGRQNAYTMESYKDIPIYPIMSNFHEANNIQVQMHRLMMNIQHHKSDVLMCHFQGDSMYNPFTQVFPNVIWYIPIEGEIVYKNHPLIRDAKKVKQVVAQTKAGHNELAKKGIKSETIYHGYAPTIFKKGWDHELEEEVIVYYPVKKSEIRLPIQDVPKIKDMMGAEFVVGFVGQNFGVRKRIERLIEAFSIFADDKKDVLLHLHCMPAHMRGVNLFEFIEYYDIADKVIFSYGDFTSSGWSDEALNVLYNSFDIFASATSAEGFGLSHLEIMPAGVPQVVPDFPPMDEFCGDDERGLRAKGMKQLSSSQSGELRFLVDPKDMAAKIQILYDDKALREKMGKNCQQWVQSYTWPKIALKFDKVFRSI